MRLLDTSTTLGVCLGLLSIVGGSMSASQAQTVQEFNSSAPAAGGHFGLSVDGIGDLNGNGADDFVVGAEFENADGPLGGQIGRVYVFDGGTGALIWDLSPPPFFGTRYGSSVAGGADISGDGIRDVIAGSLTERVVVFNGATGDTLLFLTHPDGDVDTSFGVQIANAGDFDRDGAQDILVGAYNQDVDGEQRVGRVYVFGGPNGALITALESPFLESGQLGISMDTAGDLDGDGFDDVIVGASGGRPGGLSDAGRAYVFSGATHDTLFTLTAPVPSPSAKFGESVASIGDVTGDGRRDLIVGALQETVGLLRQGRAYVFDGANGALVHTVDSPTPGSNAYFGKDVAGIDDYDGDGVDDFVVGAYLEDAGGVNGSGRVHVFSGATGAPLDMFQSPNLENFGRFGIAVAGVGDTNGDGRADFVVGAGLEAAGGLNDSGRAYLVRAPEPTSTGAVAPTTRNVFLHPNVPNPFNPRTSLRYDVTRRAHVQLRIYDATGRLVETLIDHAQDAGAHTVAWDGNGRASGVYYAVVRTEDGEARQKLTLIK